MDSERKEYYTEQFEKVLDLQRRGESSTAVREAGRIFEELLRQIIQDGMARASFATRKAIFDAESEIGKGQKGIAEFQFGQLVGVWRTSRMVEAVEQIENRSARALAGVDLNLVVDLRNDCVHNALTPDSHEVDYVISALKTYLGFLGVTVAEKMEVPTPRSIADFSDLMNARFSSVEVIEGTVAFYKRIAEVVSNPETDTFDLTFLVENPPKPAKSRGSRPLSDPTSEYFATVRRRVLSGDARLRRIITFNNPAKAAWILFNMVGAHQHVFGDSMILASFDAMRGGSMTDIMLPNIAMYYSSHDISDGIAWLYSHQEDDNQNFIGLSGKALFPTMRRLYTNWFRSCDRLTEARAAAQFQKFFGPVEGRDGVMTVAQQYRDAILLDDDALEQSVGYLARLVEMHTEAGRP